MSNTSAEKMPEPKLPAGIVSVRYHADHRSLYSDVYGYVGEMLIRWNVVATSIDGREWLGSGRSIEDAIVAAGAAFASNQDV